MLLSCDYHKIVLFVVYHELVWHRLCKYDQERMYSDCYQQPMTRLMSVVIELSLGALSAIQRLKKVFCVDNQSKICSGNLY